MKKTNIKQKDITKLEANKISLEKSAQVRGGCWGQGNWGGRPPKWLPC